jgi:hypothetical protein
MTVWLQMASAASSEPINILGGHHSHRGILSSPNYSLYGRGFDDTVPAPLRGDNNLSFRERRYRRLPLNSFWIASGDKDVDPKFPMRVKNLIEDSGNPDAPRQLSLLLQSEQVLRLPFFFSTGFSGLHLLDSVDRVKESSEIAVESCPGIYELQGCKSAMECEQNNVLVAHPSLLRFRHVSQVGTSRVC